MEEKTRLSAEEKQLIKQELGIDTDSELLSPVVDYVFKLLFTADDDASKKALIDFINCILVAEGDSEITDLTVVLPQPPAPNEQKKSIFDIRATYNNGEQVIIEMQNKSLADFKKRSQYLISRAYVSQPLSGQRYERLKKCYLICITNYDADKGSTKFMDDFRYRNRQGVELSDDQTIVFLDLTKLNDVTQKDVSEMSGVEMWLLFLKHISDESKKNIISQIVEKREGIKMAIARLQEISADEATRVQYERELIYELDYNSRMHDAEVRGMERAQAILEMLHNGKPVDEIMASTGSPREDIEKLKAFL